MARVGAWRRIGASARIGAAALLFAVSWMSPAAADLFISPLRVVFAGDDNSAEVTLVNQSDVTRTYRVEWTEKLVNAAGNYDDLEPGPGYIGASSLIRYSPRQVTLGPREQQQIRLFLDRSQEIPGGEYRSHLTLTQLGSPGEAAGAAPPGGGVGIQLNLNLSFAIPVIVRSGAESSTVRVAGAQFLYDAANRLNIQVDVARDGPFSTFGDMSVYWRPDVDSPERKIGALNNVAIYAEVPQRQAYIILTEPSLQAGILRIVYVGRAEYAGRIWFDHSLRIGN